ncbi:MAG: hypothetical protein KJ579_01440, partial [Verrucomicrobia bacterium]|nr:hypothetical protein [Verrucomicrobiota bacterium]
MKGRTNRKSGQALTEYIIIVVIVALAAISIVAIFSDTIRAKFGGAVEDVCAGAPDWSEAYREAATPGVPAGAFPSRAT